MKRIVRIVLLGITIFGILNTVQPASATEDWHCSDNAYPFDSIPCNGTPDVFVFEYLSDKINYHHCEQPTAPGQNCASYEVFAGTTITGIGTGVICDNDGHVNYTGPAQNYGMHVFQDVATHATVCGDLPPGGRKVLTP